MKRFRYTHICPDLVVTRFKAWCSEFVLHVRLWFDPKLSNELSSTSVMCDEGELYSQYQVLDA